MSRVRSTKILFRVSKLIDLIELGDEAVEERLQLRDERLRQVANLSADSRVGSGEARAGQQFKQIVELLALGEGVEENRHRAEIERHRAQAQQVGGEARRFAADHPDGLAARRKFPAHEFLDREGIGNVVRQRGEIIQPVRVRDKLVVLHVLGDLLVAAMQVTDMRRRFRHDLAIQLQLEAQHAVRRRVRRAHVEHHLFADLIVHQMQSRPAPA